jgi:hypothetical protein
MRNLRISALFALVIAGLTVAAYPQDNHFSDPNSGYAFDIPDSKWKMTVKPTATSQNVEYVYIDRNDGHLEIRKLTVGKEALLPDIIRTEEQKLQFLPGFVAGKTETFRGRMPGSIFNFEFVRAGRPMSGRFYFLRADPNTVYVLRFTGFTDKLRSIENQTDSISRTFQLNKG